MELSYEIYKKLFESASIGLALNRMDGSFVEINQAFSDITDYSKGELLELSYWDLTPKEYYHKKKGIG